MYMYLTHSELCNIMGVERHDVYLVACLSLYVLLLHLVDSELSTSM